MGWPDAYFGWGLNAGNPYVGWVTTTRNGVTTKVWQTLDAYGNQTQQKIYNTDLTEAGARVYNYTYLTGGYYTDRYIRNRVTSATFTAGGQTVTLATNVYDNNSYAGTWLTNNWAPDPYGVRLHDAAFDANFTFRGNVTQSTTLSSPVAKNFFYDLGGNVIKTTGGGGAPRGRDLLQAAFDKTIEALRDPDCRGVYGTGGTGRDPATVLTSIKDGGRYGSFTFQNGGSRFGTAQTQPRGFPRPSTATGADQAIGAKRRWQFDCARQ